MIHNDNSSEMFKLNVKNDDNSGQTDKICKRIGIDRSMILFAVRFEKNTNRTNNGINVKMESFCNRNRCKTHQNHMESKRKNQ